MTEANTFENVFDALCDTAAEGNVKARAELMLGIRERFTTWDVPQGEAAKRLGLTRPQLNDLLRDKIEKFSPDAPVNVASAAGFAPHISLGNRLIR
jgi:predicted XRE-type DNA-binding protein